MEPAGPAAAVIQGAKALCDQMDLPYLIELKSTTFSAAMGPDWVGRNPVVPVILTAAESKALAEGRPLEWKVVLAAIERALSLMRVEERGAPMQALREVYRDIFLRHVPGFWDRLKANLAAGRPPPEAARSCLLGLNLWHCDPALDPGARDLWAVAADALKNMGAAEASAQLALRAAALTKRE